MATLKAIKNNYEQLTKVERFGLYQKASLRCDENELDAIYSATPMKAFNVIDFYFLREEIYRLDTVNLLTRLGHAAMFQTFLRFADTKDQRESKYIIKSASMSAYLYVIETDAWTKVCEEIGLEVSWFRKLSEMISYAVEEMEMRDKLMRDLALTEEEASEFSEQSKNRLKVKKHCEIKNLDERINFYRELLDEI